MRVARIPDMYLDKIKNRYNPEDDFGLVTWCDIALVNAIEDLVAEVVKLTDEVERLELQIDKAGK